MDAQCLQSCNATTPRWVCESVSAMPKRPLRRWRRRCRWICRVASRDVAEAAAEQQRAEAAALGPMRVSKPGPIGGVVKRAGARSTLDPAAFAHMHAWLNSSLHGPFALEEAQPGSRGLPSAPLFTPSLLLTPLLLLRPEILGELVASRNSAAYHTLAQGTCACNLNPKARPHPVLKRMLNVAST